MNGRIQSIFFASCLPATLGQHRRKQESLSSIVPSWRQISPNSGREKHMSDELHHQTARLCTTPEKTECVYPSHVRQLTGHRPYSFAVRTLCRDVSDVPEWPTQSCNSLNIPATQEREPLAVEEFKCQRDGGFRNRDVVIFASQARNERLSTMRRKLTSYRLSLGTAAKTVKSSECFGTWLSSPVATIFW